VKTFQYNAGIRIAAVTGMAFDTANDIPPGYDDAFIAVVKKALEVLASCKTGSKLVQEIATCGRQTTIFFGDGGITSPHPITDSTKVDRLLSRLVPESMVTSEAKNSPELPRPPNTPPRPPRPTLLTTVLDRAEANGMKRKKVAALLDLSVEQLKQVEGSLRRVTPSQYYLLLMHLYDWIPPGPGCNTTVRLDATQSPSHVDKSVYKKDYAKSPLHLILGHELIHAWRMMTGRRFYQGGYEEEQMTVGLPPFHKLSFTENRLRAEFKYAIAPVYGTYGGGTNSPLAEGLRKVVENRGDKDWVSYLEMAQRKRGQHASPVATIAKGKTTWS
jgi:hypothetical protein